MPFSITNAKTVARSFQDNHSFRLHGNCRYYGERFPPEAEAGQMEDRIGFWFHVSRGSRLCRYGCWWVPMLGKHRGYGLTHILAFRRFSFWQDPFPGTLYQSHSGECERALRGGAQAWAAGQGKVAFFMDTASIGPEGRFLIPWAQHTRYGRARSQEERNSPLQSDNLQTRIAAPRA